MALAAVALVLWRDDSGDPGRYARYQQRGAAFAAIDRLLATIPAYPGARVAEREESATGYYIGANYESIEAEPYGLEVRYAVAGGASGTPIMRFFRAALPERGWRCMFTSRAQGIRRSFSCNRGDQVIGAAVYDRGGYELYVTASNVVPPIKQVPQVE